MRTPSTRLLLDCGPGVATGLSALARPSELDAVVISHLHLDHCYDLLPVGKTLLAGAMRYADHGSAAPAIDLTPVPLFVPAGATTVLNQLGSLFPVTTFPLLDKAFELAFDVREYQPADTLTVGDCTLRLHPLRHAAPNCGVRVDSPAGSLAYTGDTGVTDELVELAGGVDLLLAEATLETTDHGPHGHLSAADAAQVASDAGVGQLVLTHFPSADPDWLQARKAEAMARFAGPVHLAAPGREFPVAPHRKAAP